MNEIEERYRLLLFGTNQYIEVPNEETMLATQANELAQGSLCWGIYINN